jgi:hypothetical protein
MIFDCLAEFLKGCHLMVSTFQLKPRQVIRLCPFTLDSLINMRVLYSLRNLAAIRHGWVVSPARAI